MFADRSFSYECTFPRLRYAISHRPGPEANIYHVSFHFESASITIPDRSITLPALWSPIVICDGKPRPDTNIYHILLPLHIHPHHKSYLAYIPLATVISDIWWKLGLDRIYITVYHHNASALYHIPLQQAYPHLNPIAIRDLKLDPMSLSAQIHIFQVRHILICEGFLCQIIFTI